MNNMEISMLNYLRDAERLLASAGWSTRSEKCGAEYEPVKKEIADMVKYAKNMKLSSVLDIPFYVFSIKGVSRAFTHQAAFASLPGQLPRRSSNFGLGNELTENGGPNGRRSRHCEGRFWKNSSSDWRRSYCERCDFKLLPGVFA